MEEGRCQRGGAAIARLDGQAAGHLLAAASQRVAEDAASLTGDLPAAAQRRQAVRDAAAVDNRARLVDADLGR